MIKFKHIITEADRGFIQNYGPVVTVDIDLLYPSESVTKYYGFKNSLELAERDYLNQKSTQECIQALQQGKQLTPMKVAEFEKGYEKAGFKYGIEDGAHRYYAYKFCGVKKVPVQILQI